MLIGCKQSKFLDLNPGVSLCCAGSLKCIICLSQKEMLYPCKLLRHNSRELPIFTDQTAALSVKGGLEGRKRRSNPDGKAWNPDVTTTFQEILARLMARCGKRNRTGPR